MTNNSESEFKFNFITFNEIEAFEINQPVIYKNCADFWKILRTCPDVSSGFPCFFYITNNSNQVVCSLRAYPDILFAEGRKYPWAWVADLSTDETYRGRGLATMIIRGSQKTFHEHGIAWGGISSNDIALHIYMKLRFSFPGYGRRYLTLKTTRPLLEPFLKWKVIVHTLDLFSRPILKLILQHWFGARKMESEHFQNVGAKRMEKENADKLLDGISRQAKYHFNNAVGRLLWKLEASNVKSENESSLYILESRDYSEPLCYFVIRLKYQKEALAGKFKNFKRMTLMDYGLFKDDKEIYSVLTQEAMRLFWASDAEVFDVVTNSRLFGTVLKRSGMFKIGKGESFVFSLPENWVFGNDKEDMEKWDFTYFIGDGFTF